MKITVIHGIEHKGSTWHITQMFLEQFEDSAIRHFYLPKDMPHPCIGCNSCFLNGEDTCPHAELVQPIINVIDEADLLVIDTPVYLMSVTGQLKQFLDHMAYRWVVHRPNPAMLKKTAVAISTTGGAGAGKTNKQIRTSFSSWLIPKSYSYGKALAAAGWHMVDEQKKDKLSKDMQSLAVKVKRHMAKLSPPAFNRRILFYLFRFMHKHKGSMLVPKDNQYWHDMGWLGKKRPWH